MKISIVNSSSHTITQLSNPITQLSNSITNPTDFLPLNPGGVLANHRNHFFLSKFHPVTDCNLHTILVELPRIYQALALTPSTRQLKKTPSALFKPDDSSRLSEVMAIRTSKPSPVRANVLTAPTSHTQHKGCGSISWNIEDGSDLPQGLVVVASLVERDTNLGGLTRTCEAQGVSLLVLPRNADEMASSSGSEYQTVSLSAERWAHTHTVVRDKVEEYLRDMKRLGYCILALEQATGSCSLYEYQFPHKCVLVVGSESRGIPTNILSHVDMCIEIPQYGVIRSLNVHIATAMTIYQYNKQRAKQ